MMTFKRTIRKSTLSQYLRSQCDRQLYLSLFNDKSEMTRSSIPVPLKSRPGVQLITKSGREFETEQYEELHRAIPKRVICNNQGKASVNLLDALSEDLSDKSYFILQPSFEPETFKDTVLKNLQLSKQEIELTPALAGLRPDALYTFQPQFGDFEICSNGNRRALSEKDSRTGLSVIDLKNVVEANASYSAEVCLYAFFLSNWLALNPELSNKYFVSDKVYLWKHIEMPTFKHEQTLQNSNDETKTQALVKDLEDGIIDFVTYMPNVKKFFKEDIPRVIAQGDVYGWNSVEYHVNQKCSSCDWLGNIRWLNTEDKAIFERNPNNYCLPSALNTDHLSQITGLSKGASIILAGDGHTTVQDLVGISPSSPTLRRHSLLKRERSQIGERARALSTDTVSVDTETRVGGLAKKRNAEFNIIVNFDSGTGLLTGIAVRGILFAPFGKQFTLPDGSEQNYHVFKAKAFVVEKDLSISEWAALKGFITTMASWAEEAQNLFTENGWVSVKAQISFWEARQYEELCNAFGRHLLNILKLDNRRARALAWLFPAEELLEKNEELAPGIVFISEIIESATRLPVKFVNTLLDVADNYSIDYNQNSVDAYYREALSNAIPRERIFEIWKCTTGTVRIFGEDEPLSKAIELYGKVLINHTWALAGVIRKLREDFRGRLNGTAPAIQLSIPSGSSGVAYDSKLWIRWDNVEKKSSVTKSKAELITRADRLEASYKAIIFTNLIEELGDNTFSFQISEDSTEAKLDEGNSYYILGIVDQVGFPLMSCSSLNINIPDSEPYEGFIPIHKVIKVTLVSIDRVNKTAIISLRSGYRMQHIFNAILDQYLDLTTTQFYIAEGLSYDDSEVTETILKEVANPICSVPDSNTMKAMGLKPRTVVRGTNPNTPIAMILWEAGSIAHNEVRDEHKVQELVEYANNRLNQGLNQSQQDAIFSCCKNKLTVIWGPPGTGKTNTLAAFLHGITHEGQTSEQTRKIFITGPNYRAVDELTEKLFNNLGKDNNCDVDIIWAYSPSRNPKTISQQFDHLNAHSVQLRTPEANIINTSMGDPDRVTIIATVAHNAIKVAEQINGRGCNPIQDLFDLIVIDESSQVPMTLALRPLCLLKEDSQIIIAGDHLQMPPIASLDAPTGAEYLVGSIQTYLIKRFPTIIPKELLINYRSNQDLVDFQKSLGYPQQLSAHTPNRVLTIINTLDEVIAAMPESIIPSTAYKELLIPDRKVTALIHDDIISSQANEVEAKLVAGLAYCIRHTMSAKLAPIKEGELAEPYDDENFFKHGLGVVTPHKAQKALVIKELQTLFPDVNPDYIYDAVDTVERFQGSQRQSIIVSFGVGDIDIIAGEEEFLLQMERTNVAVSRAMAKCIILMPKSLAYHLPSDMKAVKTAKAIKSYIEEFCSNKVNIVINESDTVRAGEVRWH